MRYFFPCSCFSPGAKIHRNHLEIEFKLILLRFLIFVVCCLLIYRMELLILSSFVITESSLESFGLLLLLPMALPRLGGRSNFFSSWWAQFLLPQFIWLWIRSSSLSRVRSDYLVEERVEEHEYCNCRAYFTGCFDRLLLDLIRWLCQSFICFFHCSAKNLFSSFDWVDRKD